MATIFVSIASYRDPELAHTVDQLIRQTSTDSTLHIRILSQCLERERIAFPPSVGDGRIRIEQSFVDPASSRGVCWARAEIQRTYAEEDYYLQLDSHVQLVENWDRLLLCNMAEAVARTGEAVVLTAYLPPYRFAKGRRVVEETAPLHFKVGTCGWLPEAVGMAGYPHCSPCIAHFFSGHFAFAPGQFVTDVPYDPEIFFMGEEISMAIRAFSAGYRLFTPSFAAGSHLYDRQAREGEKRTLIWDSVEDVRRRISVQELELASRVKVAAICRGEWFGLYGVRDRERYNSFRRELQAKFGVDLSAVRTPESGL